ncbi:MAG: hypothetical protein WC405_05845 [Syntrophales bacterium]
MACENHGLNGLVEADDVPLRDAPGGDQVGGVTTIWPAAFSSLAAKA